MKLIRVCVLVILAVLAVSNISAVAWADDGAPTTDSPGLVNLSLKDVSIKSGIDALFAGRGLKYYIQPGVSGKVVELKLTGVTFEQALKAFTDAADLSYTMQDGAYIIGPAKPKAEAAAPSQNTKPTPPAAGQYVPPPVQGLAPIQPSPSTQVVVNQSPAPVYYGHPGGGAGFYGYPYPPAYQAGNVGILYGWPPVQLTGTTSVLNFGLTAPPLPGWVGPDMLRFLRSYYILQPRPYFTPGY
ncbi:MAG: STN domain-containing protein [Armatimonadetes bacterium]|nr:STN domain-containing protein [Armatimonadota bacterium]